MSFNQPTQLDIGRLAAELDRVGGSWNVTFPEHGSQQTSPTEVEIVALVNSTIPAVAKVRAAEMVTRAIRQPAELPRALIQTEIIQQTRL